MPQALFVYGTLMPGHLRWGILAPHATGHRPASVAGVLYDTGQGWPAAAFGPADPAPAGSPSGTIPGWVVDLDPASAPSLLTQLDEIEGLAPEGASAQEHRRDRYHRRLVTATDGSTAWAYEAALVDPTWRPIERWADQVEQ